MTSLAQPNWRAEVLDRLQFLQIAGLLLPVTRLRPEPAAEPERLQIYLSRLSDDEVATKGPDLAKTLDRAIAITEQTVQPKAPWRQIARDFRDAYRRGELDAKHGVSFGWVTERFDTRGLGLPSDLPDHATVGLGPHAGLYSLEEQTLLHDSYFLWERAHRGFRQLELLQRALKGLGNSDVYYEAIRDVVANVATYSRCSVSSFFSFLECFVNSVSYDFLHKNKALVTRNERAVLAGRAGRRWLSLDEKLLLVPPIVSGVGRAGAGTPSPQRTVPTQLRAIRNSATHFAPGRSRISLPAQDWIRFVDEAEVAVTAVARDFWTSCFQGQPQPRFLGRLSNATHQRIARQRCDNEEFYLPSHQKAKVPGRSGRGDVPGSAGPGG